MTTSKTNRGMILFSTLSFAQDFEEVFWGHDGILRITWRQYNVENLDSVVDRIEKETPMRKGLHFDVQPFANS